MIRKRGNKFVAEKMKAEETPDQAALRGLEEELQISGVPVVSSHVGHAQKESPTYLGIQSNYNTYYYNCEIPHEKYLPSYVERQVDKRTYFTWEAVRA